VGKPRVSHVDILDHEHPDLVESLEMGQPGVGDLGIGDVESFQIGEASKVRKSLIADFREAKWINTLSGELSFFPGNSACGAGNC
jgi:hypothetical protein